MMLSNIPYLKTSAARALAALVMLLASAWAPFIPAARAQFSNKITHTLHDPSFSLGHDFWIAEMSNNWGYYSNDSAQIYMRLSITSTQNTTAYIAYDGILDSVEIQAMRSASVSIPRYMQMESSGIVENKSIHIWSNNASLNVYNMNHIPYSSDGEYVFPTIGWGTDYVVAATESFFATAGTIYDYPSELAVVADQYTKVEIIPSCNCRQAKTGTFAGDSASTVVVYQAGNTYTWWLSRGQSLELFPVKATDSVNFDLTGTIIHADHPVGVLGGASEANIPANYPYSDHVESMMPPVRLWGKTYYCTNWIQPAGSPDNNTRYLFISSKAGQTIYRSGCNSGRGIECIIPDQYGVYWDELSSGQKFWSDQPFLLVANINSATYPGGQNGQGDPAETIITPKENFIDSVTFQCPLSVGNIIPYTNYANVIVNNLEAKYTYFDGQRLSGGQCLDDTFEILNIPKIAPGAHSVENRTEAITGKPSHGGIGVYVYGYGYDESYAWSSPGYLGTVNSPDTVSPRADTIDNCSGAFIHLSDSGLLPDRIHSQSGIAEVILDSAYNMSFVLDKNFISDSSSDTTGYGAVPIDPTQSGVLIVTAYDTAGNSTTITTQYAPSVIDIEPKLQNLGAWTSGTPNVAFDTIINTGQTTFQFTQLTLLKGNVGFSLHSPGGGPVDISPLNPGSSRLIQIQFHAIDSSLAWDSILIGNGCVHASAMLIGAGGANDFFVTDGTWQNVALTKPATCYKGYVTIENVSKGSISIDSAWSSNSLFHIDTTLPITLPPAPGSVSFPILFCPDSSSISHPEHAQMIWTSKQVLNSFGVRIPHYDSLVGTAVLPKMRFYGDTTTSIIVCPQPGETADLTLSISVSGSAPGIISKITETDTTHFINVKGTLPSGNTWDPTKESQMLPAGQTAEITVEGLVPPGQNDTLKDTLIAFDGFGDTIPLPVNVQVIGQYFAMDTIPDVPLGPVPYKSSPITKTFTISNPTWQPLIIYTIIIDINKYLGAYVLNLPDGIKLPDTIQPGQMLIDSIRFDPSYSSDTDQSVQVFINSNSCIEQQFIAKGRIGPYSGVELESFQWNTSIIPIDEGHAISIQLPDAQTAPAKFELFNILGERVMARSIKDQNTILDASALPYGLYFYRLSSSGSEISGKLILGKS